MTHGPRYQRIEIATRGRGTLDVTSQVAGAVAAAGVDVGIALVFCHHTSASLLLCENADPEVRADLERYLSRLAPDGDPLFRHDAEGEDDMPAHVRTIVTGSSLTLPLAAGRLQLGTWQGVYLYEHRAAPHRRTISVTVVGS
jgi:secondary thiamine-phosphate synthase enzyme